MTAAIALPLWPPAGNHFFILAARALNKWLALGVPARIAYAMIAQGEAECAFKLTAIGDKGVAYGLHQWHWTPRGAAIFAATGIDVRSEPMIEQHVAAAYWELTHLFATSWAKILAAPTALQAGEMACKLWEGAGAFEAAERRGMMAERWLSYFAHNPDVLKGNPAQS